MRTGVFTYEEPQVRRVSLAFVYSTSQETTPKTIEWYINFADHDLFRFYGGQLFAADEIQVILHLTFP